MKNIVLIILIALIFMGCTSNIPERKVDTTWLLEDCTDIPQCTNFLQRIIALYWSRPPGSKNGMEVLLYVELDNDRNLQNVEIVEGSGFDEFDSSAVQAVKKAAPFHQLQGLPKDVYNRYFKNFQFLFQPVDLRE